jgi:hypothetical protein
MSVALVTIHPILSVLNAATDHAVGAVARRETKRAGVISNQPDSTIQRVTRRPERPQYDSPGRSPGYRADRVIEALKGRDSTARPCVDCFCYCTSVVCRDRLLAAIAPCQGLPFVTCAHPGRRRSSSGSLRLASPRRAFGLGYHILPFQGRIAVSRRDHRIGHWLCHAATFAH